MVLGAGRRDDREQRGVDAVRARGQDAELAALLAARGEEAPGALEVVAADHAAQDAAGRYGRAVVGHHQRDLTGRHHDQRRPLHGVGPRPEPEVQAGGQRVRLVAGLALQGDEAAAGQRGPGEALDDDTDLALADPHEAQQRPGQQRGRDQREEQVEDVRPEGRHGRLRWVRRATPAGSARTGRPRRVRRGSGAHEGRSLRLRLHSLWILGKRGATDHPAPCTMGWYCGYTVKGYTKDPREVPGGPSPVPLGPLKLER